MLNMDTWVFLVEMTGYYLTPNSLEICKENQFIFESLSLFLFYHISHSVRESM